MPQRSDPSQGVSVPEDEEKRWTQQGCPFLPQTTQLGLLELVGFGQARPLPTQYRSKTLPGVPQQVCPAEPHVAPVQAPLAAHVPERQACPTPTQ